MLIYNRWIDIWTRRFEFFGTGQGIAWRKENGDRAWCMELGVGSGSVGRPSAMEAPGNGRFHPPYEKAD
jgi:hypothetical protein